MPAFILGSMYETERNKYSHSYSNIRICIETDKSLIHSRGYRHIADIDKVIFANMLTEFDTIYCTQKQRRLYRQREM